MRSIHCQLLCTGLLTVLSACTGSKQAWWEDPSPCKPPATLHGSPPSRQATADPAIGGLPPRIAEVWCGTSPRMLDRQGRYTSWHPNGQMWTDSEVMGTEAQWLKSWDEQGRLTAERRSGEAENHLQWWHDNGQLAAQGSLVERHREGVWKHWDAQGTLVGEVLFTGGQATEVRLDTSKMLLIDPVGAATNGSDLHLPTSPSLESATLGTSIVLGQNSIVINGLPYGRALTDPVAFLSEVGRANERQPTSPLLLQVDTGRPWPEVRAMLELLIGTGQGVHLVTQHPDDVWPPQNAYERRSPRFTPFVLPVSELPLGEFDSVQGVVDALTTR